MLYTGGDKLQKLKYQTRKRAFVDQKRYKAICYIIGTFGYTKLQAMVILDDMKRSAIDLYQEFLCVIWNGNYLQGEEPPIIVEGHTAESIANESKLSILYAYIQMIYLRKNSEEKIRKESLKRQKFN